MNSLEYNHIHLLDLKNNNRWWWVSDGPSKIGCYNEAYMLAGDYSLAGFYDPSNGTTSAGPIIRSNKGEMNKPEPRQK